MMKEVASLPTRLENFSEDLHHGGEEVLVAELFDVVQILCLPGHVLYLTVNPLLDEFLRGIVVLEGVGQLVPTVQAVVGRESEMLLTVSKPYSAQLGKLFQCFFFCHSCFVLKGL